MPTFENRHSLFAAIILIGVLASPAYSQTPQLPNTSIDKIASYAGTWRVETETFDTAHSKAAKETRKLHNDCWRSAGFYTCDQIVDGESKALIVFTYNAADGSYKTHPISAGGDASDTGKLIIDGNVWTFPWQSSEQGVTTYYRVVNVFVSDKKIEFRQEFSTDNAHWTLMSKGIETRQANTPK